MKALITGATGFIGSHLAELLVSKGYEIRVPIRKTSDRKWLKEVAAEY
ncbi:MAG TPA: GDP-mannose 4,6-dehydratase, partial [Bacteroidota bacterium]|nr:GDP-mannose 4,6-dehydratase [Bacteroidota bacterium]